MDKINPPSWQKILHQINLWQASIFVKAFIDGICLISLPTSVLYVLHQISIMGRTSSKNSFDVKKKEFRSFYTWSLGKILTKSITWILQNFSWTNSIQCYPFFENYLLLDLGAEIYFQLYFRIKTEIETFKIIHSFL